jgi:hypothetical protein
MTFVTSGAATFEGMSLMPDLNGVPQANAAEICGSHGREQTVAGWRAA